MEVPPELLDSEGEVGGGGATTLSLGSSVRFFSFSDTIADKSSCNSGHARLRGNRGGVKELSGLEGVACSSFLRFC